MTKLVIIGAGGHAKVIAETVSLNAHFELVGFIDDAISVGTIIYKSYSVIGDMSQIGLISQDCDEFVMGIGNNSIRKSIDQTFSGKVNWTSIIHPNAVISETAQIGVGTIVLAGAVINAGVQVGNFCIVNSNVVVDHEATIGSYTHLAIGTLVGSNSIVLPLVKTDIGQAIPSFSTV